MSFLTTSTFFFFFWIGKKSYINRRLLHQKNEVGKENIYKQHQKTETENYVQEEKESKNSWMDSLAMKHECIFRFGCRCGTQQFLKKYSAGAAGCGD